MSDKLPEPAAPSPFDSVIQSRHNPTFKHIRSLLRRDRRLQERAFVVEGPRLIADAIARGKLPNLVLIDESSPEGALDVDVSPLTVRLVNHALYREISDSVTPQGILAVFDLPDLQVSDHRPRLALVCDRIQDPGNLGSLLRSAAAASCNVAFYTNGTVDPYSLKVVRSAAGAHFQLPIKRLDRQSAQDLSLHFPTILAADASAATSLFETNLSGDLAIIVGSEAHGVSDELNAVATERVAIPIAIESLNAAVAGSIFLFEVIRQRRVNEREHHEHAGPVAPSSR